MHFAADLIRRGLEQYAHKAKALESYDVEALTEIIMKLRAKDRTSAASATGQVRDEAKAARQPSTVPLQLATPIPFSMLTVNSEAEDEAEGSEDSERGKMKKTTSFVQRRGVGKTDAVRKGSFCSSTQDTSSSRSLRSSFSEVVMVVCFVLIK